MTVTPAAGLDAEPVALLVRGEAPQDEGVATEELSLSYQIRSHIDQTKFFMMASFDL